MPQEARLATNGQGTKSRDEPLIQARPDRTGTRHRSYSLSSRPPSADPSEEMRPARIGDRSPRCSGILVRLPSADERSAGCRDRREELSNPRAQLGSGEAAEAQQESVVGCASDPVAAQKREVEAAPGDDSTNQLSVAVADQKVKASRVAGPRPAEAEQRLERLDELGALRCVDLTASGAGATRSGPPP